MKIGMVGLGRMGAEMVKRLTAGGHECVVYDRDEGKRNALVPLARVQLAASIDELAEYLMPEPGEAGPRVVWCMLPAGAPTEETVHQLAMILSPGDIVIDGGNSFYKDDVRRATELSRQSIHYLDVGVSGGVWGRERGYCLMFGGSKDAAQILDPVFRTLAPQESDAKGYIHCGPPGSGHFVKMVHNGIEYGMMQALAEGFHLLENAKQESVEASYRYNLDLAGISETWRRGSVVSSWLLDLTALALKQDAVLTNYSGRVEDSGEGRWTVQAAIERGVPADVITSSLFARFRSRETPSYADKLLSAMRHGFGGHGEAAKGAGGPAARPTELRKGA